jgi:integrase
MLNRDVERHVALRRALGFKFRHEARTLRQFADFATAQGDTFVRNERVLAWAAQTSSAVMRHTRVARVRRFAIAMQAEDPRHEVPSRDCAGWTQVVRKAPYIYTPEEIGQLMAAAGRLPADGWIAPGTFTTLLGLLASTGLRISEAMALECPDIVETGLLIHNSKHGKSRLLPLHATTRSALETYLGERGQRHVVSRAMFVSSPGRPLKYQTVRSTFRWALEHGGFRPAADGTWPRMHDLRHTFAVRSLEQCRHDRTAVARHMAALSHYLGHTNVTDTYWYLEATPFVMGKIAEAGEAMYRGDVA